MKRAFLISSLVCVLLVVVTVICVIVIGGSDTLPNDTYDINLEIESEDFVKGEATIVYFAEDDVDHIYLSLYPNAYRYSLPLEEDVLASLSEEQKQSRGGYEYLDVEVNGKHSQYALEHDDQFLRVNLVSGIAKNERVTLTLKFNIRLPNIPYRFGYTDDVINLNDFYPQLCPYVKGSYIKNRYTDFGDPFAACVADYTLTLRVAKQYTVACSLMEQFSRELVDTKIISYSGENIRSLALSLSRKFRILTDEVEGKRVNFYYLEQDTPMARFEVAKSAFSFYCSTFGDYPYPQFSLVETDFLEGGMEYSALAYVKRAVPMDDFTEIAAHEISHEWWSAAVGSDSYCEPWLDEALAVYSTYLFMDFLSPEASKKYYNASRQAFLHYAGLSHTVEGVCSYPMTSLSAYTSSYDYSATVYSQGLIMLVTASEVCGDLIPALSAYYRDNIFSFVSSDDFFTAIARHSPVAAKVIAAFVDGKARYFT